MYRLFIFVENVSKNGWCITDGISGRIFLPISRFLTARRSRGPKSLKVVVLFLVTLVSFHFCPQQIGGASVIKANRGFIDKSEFIFGLFSQISRSGTEKYFQFYFSI